jgi:hypothetical protein
LSSKEALISARGLAVYIANNENLGIAFLRRATYFPIAAQTALRGLLPGTFDNIRPSVVYVTRITEKHFHGSALLLLETRSMVRNRPKALCTHA